MTKVVWSDLAKKNLRKTIDYLFENWTVKEVESFKNKLSILIENISKNNSFCPQSKVYDLRKCLIDKNNSLIYLFKNNTILIVTLFNNKSSHQY